MEFLDIGEKLKKLRKQLKMKQEDLVDINITRAFISMIEIGKRTPNKDTAKVIITKLKNKADELGIILDVDNLYLTRDARSDAQLFCTEKLQDMSSTKDINAIIEIGIKYKLDAILALAYVRQGGTTFQDRNYIDAFVCYVTALECYKYIDVTSEYPYLYNMMGRCKMNQLQYIEALSYFNLSSHHALLQNDFYLRKRAIYNVAVCNKKLNQIEECIKYIDIYLSICDKEQDFTVYIYANVLKSTCYETRNLYDKSIDILKSLLQDFNGISSPLLGLIYNNLGILYFKKRIFHISIEYFDKSEEIRASVDKSNLSHTIIEKASVYIEQGLDDQAITLLKHGLDLATTSNDIEYQLKSSYALADIYIHLNLQEDAEKVYLKVLSLLEQTKFENYKDESINIFVKLSSIYLEQNNIPKLKESIQILQKISGK